MPTLQILGQLTPERTRQWARLAFDHGEGYVPSILVGNSAGEIQSYVLNFNPLPDRSSDTRFVVADAEDGGASKTWRVYLEDFVERRAVDGASFDVTDQTTGNTVECVLADYSLSLQLIGEDLYSAQLRLKQWRDAA